LVEVSQIPTIFLEARQNLPSQAITHREAAVHLKLILGKETELRRSAANIRTRNRKVEVGGRSFQKITESISGKCRLEDKCPEVIGGELRREALQVKIANVADIQTRLERVLPKRKGDVVAELRCLRLSNSGFISPDDASRVEIAIEACTSVEVKGRASGGAD
jgi:hypothetical protein